MMADRVDWPPRRRPTRSCGATGALLVDERELPSRQARTVLAVLAVSPMRSVSRDDIAIALWEDSLPEAWDAAVRAIVSKLRRPVAPAVIAAAAGHYQLVLPPGGWVDVVAARQAVHLGERAAQAGEYDTAGPEALVASTIAGRSLLPGLDGQWIEDERRRLLDIKIRALECLSMVWLAKGDVGQAARDAEAVIGLDPYRESAYRLAMRAHAAAGNRGVAALLYERCRSTLATDLGVEPSAETADIPRGLTGRR